MTAYIPLIVVGLLFILGLLFWNGKALFLIAGYNTMSKYDKQKIDSTALAKFIAKIMWCASAGAFIITYADFNNVLILHTVGVAIILGSCLFAVVYANTSNRFKQKQGH